MLANNPRLILTLQRLIGRQRLRGVVNFRYFGLDRVDVGSDSAAVLHVVAAASEVGLG